MNFKNLSLNFHLKLGYLSLATGLGLITEEPVHGLHGSFQETAQHILLTSSVAKLWLIKAFTIL